MTEEIKTDADIPSIEDHPDYVCAEEDGGAKVAFGVHVLMTNDGNFIIQGTGTPSLGEMHMILARAIESVKARMVAETVVELLSEHKKSRIITPSLVQ